MDVWTKNYGLMDLWIKYDYFGKIHISCAGGRGVNNAEKHDFRLILRELLALKNGIEA